MNKQYLFYAIIIMCPHAEDKVPFDLKSFPGVTELEKVTDTYSSPINIPGGLMFGKQTVNTAYVSAMHSSVMPRSSINSAAYL